MPNLLLATYKPPLMSSNIFLSKLKRHFGESKGGYLGTLDPFAQGMLVVGLGNCTRLFSHLKKSPKVYVATLWLGAQSPTLDIEGVQKVEEVAPKKESEILESIVSLRGEIEYYPPYFSAKHINGQRAYKLAREGKAFELPLSTMKINDIKLLHYCHPFVKFWVSVDEGAYVRSIGQIIAKNLSTTGILSALERISEGDINLQILNTKETCSQGDLQYQILNPLHYLPYLHLESPLELHLAGHWREMIYSGKKFALKNIQKGKYIVCFEDFFSIIEVLENGDVKYILNRIGGC